MKTPIDITGLRFGRLVALYQIGTKEFEWGNNKKKYYETVWRCKCDCGREIEAERRSLIRGMKSCGCLQFEKKRNELIGKRFGMLVIIDFAFFKEQKSGIKKSYWKCRCDCGREKTVELSSLKCGYTKSCGCWVKECHSTHRGYYDRLYGIWNGIKYRCDKKHGNLYYVNKGIEVCENWLNNYAEFKEWAYEHGYDENAPKYKCTLDRIDNNKGYNPDNCRWVDMTVQANNRSNNRYIEYNGEKMSISQWASRIGISKSAIRERLNKGWPVEEVLSSQRFYGGKHDRDVEERKEKV